MISTLVAPPRSSIREAIEQTFEACYSSLNPLRQLAECVETLKAEGWTDAETQRVELPVLKMLVALSSPDNTADEPNSKRRW